MVADGSGIPPGDGVGIVDTQLAPPDFTLPGLQCLRALAGRAGRDAERVRKGIAETRASLPREGLPVVVVHGLDDGLVPPAFSSAPYVAAAQAAGRDVQLLAGAATRSTSTLSSALPDYGARYVPLLPYVYAALDRVDAHLDGKAHAAGRRGDRNHAARRRQAAEAGQFAIPALALIAS